MRTFVDTNVLMYAYDHAEAAKHDRAIEILADIEPGELVVSAQVLNEFYVVTTRPDRGLLSKLQAREAVAALSATSVEPVDADLVRRATSLHGRSEVPYWDSMIIAAAARAGCARVLTEDLSDGSVVDGVRIENPFRQDSR